MEANQKYPKILMMKIFHSDETNASLKNANTIDYIASTNEQIDNAELQEKSTSSGLDDNENDKESKTRDDTDVASSETEKTTPTSISTDLNNGPFNGGESYVSINC